MSINQGGNISSAIGVVKSRPADIGPGQEAADAARALECAAKVQAARIRDERHVAGVPLLDHGRARLSETRLVAVPQAETGKFVSVGWWACGEVLASMLVSRYSMRVSMAELMRVVAGLPEEQQTELAAFLLHLRLKQDPEWRAEMTRRIDDKNPANWISLEDWKEELAGSEE